MGGIRFSVCECQSENLFVCLARNPHKGPAREISHEIGRTREGRSQRQSDERAFKRRTICWREQQRPVGMRGQSREEGHSQQKGEQKRQSTEMKAGREDKSALLVALWEFSLEYPLALANKMHKKCHKLLPRLELTHVRVCLFVCSFLPHSRLCFAYL